jgi:hypothetical protein
MGLNYASMMSSRGTAPDLNPNSGEPILVAELLYAEARL